MGKLKKNKIVYYSIILLFFLALYGLIELAYHTGALVIFGLDTHTLKLMFINIMLAVSLNVVTGFLGQLALGHAGFMSVGAYASALLTLNATKFGLPEFLAFPLALLVGGLTAVVFGFIIGIPTLRLKGDYLAILTLGFSQIIVVLMNNLPFTGGASGLAGMAPLSTIPILYVITLLTVVILYRFGTSRHGRAVRAIRDNEIAAESSGINLTYYKLLAFVIAAFFAGIAGGLYSHHMLYIDPTTFDYNRSIEILIMVVLGGMGSVTGSITAAVILTMIPNILRNLNLDSFQMLLYALILILLMLFRPYGLFGKNEFSPKAAYAKIKRIFKKKSSEEGKNV